MIVGALFHLDYQNDIGFRVFFFGNLRSSLNPNGRGPRVISADSELKKRVQADLTSMAPGHEGAEDRKTDRGGGRAWDSWPGLPRAPRHHPKADEETPATFAYPYRTILLISSGVPVLYVKSMIVADIGFTRISENGSSTAFVSSLSLRLLTRTRAPDLIRQLTAASDPRVRARSPACALPARSRNRRLVGS